MFGEQREAVVSAGEAGHGARGERFVGEGGRANGGVRVDVNVNVGVFQRNECVVL